MRGTARYIHSKVGEQPLDGGAVGSPERRCTEWSGAYTNREELADTSGLDQWANERRVRNRGLSGGHVEGARSTVPGVQGIGRR